MSWLFSAALLPFVLCGVMCLGGALLAALGLRNSTREAPTPPTAETGSRPVEDAVDR